MVSSKPSRDEKLRALSCGITLGFLLGVGSWVWYDMRTQQRNSEVSASVSEDYQLRKRERTIIVLNRVASQQEESFNYEKSDSPLQNPEDIRQEQRSSQNISQKVGGLEDALSQVSVSPRLGGSSGTILQDGRDLTKLDIFDLYDLTDDPNQQLTEIIAAHKQMLLAYYDLSRTRRVGVELADDSQDPIVSLLNYAGLHDLADYFKPKRINSSSFSMDGVPRYLKKLAAGVDPFTDEVPSVPLIVRPTLATEMWPVMKEDLDNGKITAICVTREDALARLLSHAYGETIVHVWGEGLDLNQTPYDFVVNVAPADRQTMYLEAAEKVAEHFDLSWELTGRKVPTYVVTQIPAREHLLENFRNTDGKYFRAGVNRGTISSNVTMQEFVDSIPMPKRERHEFAVCDVEGFYDLFVPHHFIEAESGYLAVEREEEFNSFLANTYGLSMSQHSEEGEKVFLKVMPKR
jgi:hypothetical protein